MRLSYHPVEGASQSDASSSASTPRALSREYYHHVGDGQTGRTSPHQSNVATNRVFGDANRSMSNIQGDRSRQISGGGSANLDSRSAPAPLPTQPHSPLGLEIDIGMPTQPPSLEGGNVSATEAGRASSAASSATSGFTRPFDARSDRTELGTDAGVRSVFTDIESGNVEPVDKRKLGVTEFRAKIERGAILDAVRTHGLISPLLNLTHLRDETIQEHLNLSLIHI